MDKTIKIGIAGIIITLLLAMYFGGLFAYFNQPLNEFIKGTPDKSCNIDSDCTLKRTTCHICNCGDAVNKDWEPVCPFPRSGLNVMCKPCPSVNYDFDIKCIENECQRIWRTGE